MSKWIIKFWIGLTLLLTVSCNKDHPDPEQEVDIYISGYTGTIPNSCAAVYWKNGEMIALTNPSNLPSYANDILLIGDDLYVVGVVIDKERKAVYWKNGEMITLSDGNSYAYAQAIVSDGADVYIVGRSGKPGYWKNETFNPASTDQPNRTYLHDIAVYGSDVHLVGIEVWSGIVYSLYWKNGNLKRISGSNPTTLQVAAGSSGVYICGNAPGGYLFLNNDGVGSSQSGPTGSVRAVATSGSDFYFSATTMEGPIYGKNDVVKKLEDNLATPGAIQASDEDIYVIGNIIGNSPQLSSAVYWKNGKPISLSSTVATTATGLCVIPSN